MKSLPILVVLSGLLCGILPIFAFAQDTPNGVRGGKEDQTSTAKIGNQYALVVGVSKYHNMIFTIKF